MNPSKKFPRRFTMTVVACAAVLIVGAASALGQSAPPNDASPPTLGGRSGAGAS